MDEFLILSELKQIKTGLHSCSISRKTGGQLRITVRAGFLLGHASDDPGERSVEENIDSECSMRKGKILKYQFYELM